MLLTLCSALLSWQRWLHAHGYPFKVCFDPMMGVTLRCRYDLEIEIDRFTNARNDVNKVGAPSCMPLIFLLYTT